jgi:hypothetical protein
MCLSMTCQSASSKSIGVKSSPMKMAAFCTNQVNPQTILREVALRDQADNLKKKRCTSAKAAQIRDSGKYEKTRRAVRLVLVE